MFSFPQIIKILELMFYEEMNSFFCNKSCMVVVCIPGIYVIQQSTLCLVNLMSFNATMVNVPLRSGGVTEMMTVVMGLMRDDVVSSKPLLFTQVLI